MGMKVARGLYSLWIVVLAASLNNAHATSQHMICKTVETVFTNEVVGPNFSRPKAFQGPVGNRGPSGVKGEPGLPGSKGERGIPSTFNPADVENMMEMKISAATKELRDRIEILENKVTELNSTSASGHQSAGGFDELVAKVNQLQDLLTWYKASNGYYYKVFAERVTYATAKAKCVEYGGILASRGPRDTHVRGELVNLMKQDDPHHTWIGANDILSEGTWVWEDGVVSNAMDWRSGEPNNNLALGNEDCAHYRPGEGWKVNDVRCEAEFKFLCEKKYNVEYTEKS